MVKEGKALLIGDTAESIIRVLALQIYYQLRKLMVLPEVCNTITQRLPADN